MLRKTRPVALLLAVVMLTTACFGSFNLTRKLYNWNASPDDKWVQEGYFLVTGVLLPVYGLAALGDALIFNSIEFWTGENPVEMASGDETGPVIGEAEAGEDAVRVELTRDGQAPGLRVIHEVDGEPAATFDVVRAEGETRVQDADGVPVLRAIHRPDGGMIILDARGERIGMVDAEQIQQFAARLGERPGSPALAATPAPVVDAVTTP